MTYGIGKAMTEVSALYALAVSEVRSRRVAGKAGRLP
jgi:hypothetical protein